MGWLEEGLMVLAYSKRTQVAIVLGVTSFMVISAAGEYFVGRVNLQGIFAPLTDMIREALLGRYDNAAWASLWSFLLLAIRFYRKDRKRFLAW